LTALPHIPQAGGIQQIRIILEMFHVKHFGPIGAHNLTRPKTAAFLNIVESTDFFLQLESSVGGVSTPEPVAKGQLRCKIDLYQDWQLGQRPNAAWLPPLPSSDNSSVIVAEHFCTGLRPSRVATSSDKAGQAVHEAHLALRAGIRDRAGQCTRRAASKASGWGRI
jgi:hypothetical protein